MAKSHDVFIYVGTYPSADAANEDMKLLRDLKGEGSYDTAVISKDDKGKVHVKKRESAVSNGLWVAWPPVASLPSSSPSG